MDKKRVGIILAIATIVTGVLITQNRFISAPEILTVPSTSQTPFTLPPSITPTYEGCGYMWTYHDDPELSSTINEAIQGLNNAAEANVQLFGEDCVYADGHSTFSVMETDFYVRLKVHDLNDFESFGDWVKEAMSVVTSLSDDEIQGKSGYVEFSFIKSDADQIIIRIVISDYLNVDPNISAKELFALFYIPP